MTQADSDPSRRVDDSDWQTVQRIWIQQQERAERSSVLRAAAKGANDNDY